jgi:SSS family solute:Na+ symporter
MAAMMSSSDSMLLSGSSYLTRDIYRPLVANPDERREAWLGRLGVVVFATLTFVASLFQVGTLLEIGDTAFSGFAQLALPVIVALYWSRTTRWGIYAGIGASQLFYLASVFVDVVPSSYLGGWSASVVGMLLGLVLTVVVSAATSPATAEDPSVYEQAPAD